VLREIR